ncbi:MAG: PrsW family intramembrane metalloprotease [Firmicutes bacterium]|nr:PrsW family intramembrane metalloprotease [Alicyclobacillaceae bacterium]MCL6497521.1 PrsW family intramembrane metalloprotease [Bacillota bacterium]
MAERGARPRPEGAALFSRQYWGLLLLAVVPMLLEAFRFNVVAGMMVYFSLFWFFLFRRMAHLRLGATALAVDLLAYLFAATVGAGLAALLESGALGLGAGPFIRSPHLPVAAASTFLCVGLVEEGAKQVWIWGVVVWDRLRHRPPRPPAYLMLGIMSGLGFSAVENIDYVQRGIFLDISQHVGGVGVVTALTRALYTPFLHAVWAGAVAWAWGRAARDGRWGRAVGAWLGAAALHGLYDASLRFNVWLSLAVVTLSYAVFLLAVRQVDPMAGTPEPLF